MTTTTGCPTDGSEGVEAAAEVLRERLRHQPEVLLVLGSGLGHLADAVEDAVRVPFTDLPGFPEASVSGHAGCFVQGRLEGRPVLVQQGRYHLYEGHPLDIVARPVRTARALGIRSMIVTNAAGGIRRDLGPGSIVLIDDQINLQFRNPLVGPARPRELRFPDMSAPYSSRLMALAEQVAVDERLPLSRGVYAAVTGPSYETPAEVRMLHRLGADLVGMSTVPEVIAARAAGMQCLGLSLVTNVAAGRSPHTLDHAEVVEVGRRAGATLERLLRGVVARFAPAPCD